MAKPKKDKLSTQDIRDQVISLRDTLVRNLTFLEQVIEKDCDQLQEYFNKFGDLKYRPEASRDVDGNIIYGHPTEINLMPLAGEYRTTIKSLLDSIKLIDSEIMPAEDPEIGNLTKLKIGEESESRLGVRASIRHSFISDTGPAISAPNIIREDENNSEEDELSVKDIVITQKAKDLDKEETPKPWRDQTPKPQIKFVPNHNVNSVKPEQITDVVNPELIKQPQTVIKPSIGLSPTLKAKLESGMGRLNELRNKYQNQSEDDSEEE